MSNPIPGAANKTIGDLVPEVVNALQGRTDISTAIGSLYIKRAIQEITESYPFEELRRTGPQVSLTVGQSTYPATLFLNPGDDYTLNSSFALFVDFPGNTVVSPVNYKTPAAIEMMIAPATQGIPSRWTRYGANIFLGPTPNQPFTVFFRYQLRHQFKDGDNLAASPMFIPDTWEEIVAYAAAERVALFKRWNDQAKFLHDALYGDPEYQVSDGKRGRPGLLAARVFQQERDEQQSSRQLIPLVPRYCAH